MFFSSRAKVRIEKTLLDRLTEVAKVAGYANVEEFIVHILEREAEKFDQDQDDEEVEKRLRGLGYIE